VASRYMKLNERKKDQIAGEAQHSHSNVTPGSNPGACPTGIHLFAYAPLPRQISLETLTLDWSTIG
jgi:hypothetical protein